ncbi:putative single-strand DNA-specific exonuclease [Staphylococcus phage vB_SepS_BE02]|nr:putative single-strand DNA-specific exonuclease [Staphylococcus phage vB_SepS_BE02]WNM53722.1 RecJ-like ssDNA exonuclease [Staphylococcus phage S-CoN_Ph14]WNM53977.1 RecJ-like ssDNA exonuclease [Staphylococcus phage S-CoN_Ph15]WNM54061.1 RecJ-like ssDNA exonuclease [Staphylococcus phage S-CoN_Ph16]
MEFELKKQITGNIIDDAILRAVDDIDYHRKPDDRYMGNFKHLPIPFIKSTYELFGSISDNKKIGILVDNDADGFTASSLLYRFITTNLKYHNIVYIITEGKTHGLSTDAMEEVYEKEVEFLIIPDAASNDKDQIEELIDSDINVLVLDHHEVNIKDVPSVVINNQLLEGVNKNFTGVGMVYLFCKIYCNEFLSRDVVDKYLDLVALGQTGDVSDISNPEIRYLAYTGVRNINNPFIKAVMERKSIENPTTRDWSFSIISMINAVTRIGTIEEKHRLFEALAIDYDTTRTVEIRKKNRKTGKFDKIEVEMTFPEIVAKECESIKAKQDKIVKEALGAVKYIYKNNVLIGILDSDYPSSINGLIAMKLSDKYRKPVMIGRWITDILNNYYLSGSIRAQNIDFKSILLRSGLFNFVQGHSQAAGFSINETNLEDLYEYLDNYKFKTNNKYEVDVLTDKPNESDIIQVELNKDVLGGAIQYPLFGYEEIEFNKRCINKRGSVLSFFDDNVTFVLFNAPDGIKEEIDNNIVNNKITMNIVGEPRINKFGNKEQSQIVIKDYEILEVEEKENENDWGIDF